MHYAYTDDTVCICITCIERERVDTQWWDGMPDDNYVFLVITKRLDSRGLWFRSSMWHRHPMSWFREQHSPPCRILLHKTGPCPSKCSRLSTIQTQNYFRLWSQHINVTPKSLLQENTACLISLFRYTFDNRQRSNRFNNNSIKKYEISESHWKMICYQELGPLLLLLSGFPQRSGPTVKRPKIPKSGIRNVGRLLESTCQIATELIKQLEN